MLNRKKSNLIFYGILAGIVLFALILRILILTSFNSSITEVTASNRAIASEIEALRDTVQDNKDKQTEQLFELYDEVPQVYDQTTLTLYTIAQLELAGVSENSETQRSVLIDSNFSAPADSAFKDVKNDFKLVEVEIYFNTTTFDSIELFVDALYDSEQVFVINSIDFYNPDGTNAIGVTISFLAFYAEDSTS